MTAAVRASSMRFDIGQWGPTLMAVCVLLGGWLKLRSSWDQRVLDGLLKEMTDLRSRVTSLEGELKALNRDLDDSQGKLAVAQRELAAAISDRDRHAELSVQQAGRLIELEAAVARAQVREEALLAQIALAERRASQEHAGEALQSGDAVVIVKDGSV